MRQALSSSLLSLVVLLLCAAPAEVNAACAVPNTFTNGQTADATQVMANFNSVAGCVNNAVTGTPASGNLAKFSSPTSITNGDLSGDVTTSGTLTTTITNNAVTLAKLATQADKTVLANISGGAAVPSASSLSAVIDNIFGSTQGQILYRDASAWTTLAPGSAGYLLATGGAGANPSWVSPATGSGTEVLISEQMPSGTGTVSFTSIPATYRDLRVVVRGRGDTAAASVSVTAQFNSDTGTNYARVRVGSSGSTTVNTVVTRGDTSMPIGVLPAATATADYAGSVEARIYDYRGTTFHKVTESHYVNANANTDNATLVNMIGTFWRSTAAVTRVDVNLAAGNFVTGSVVSLYGVY